MSTKLLHAKNSPYDEINRNEGEDITSANCANAIATALESKKKLRHDGPT